MNDRPGADSYTGQHTVFTRDRHLSMPAAGFDPTIPVHEQPQTHVSDRAATGIGHTKNKLRGLSPHANYTDRAAVVGRRS